MPDGVKELPVEVRDEMKGLVSALLGRGWSLVTASAIGTSICETVKLPPRLAKDRSQYMMDGSEVDELKAAGLFRAFDGLQEFRNAITNWLATANRARSSTRG